MSENVLVYTFEQLAEDVKVIKEKITLSGKIPDVVIGISRGGLVPGVMLSHALKVPFMPLTIPMNADEVVDLLDDLERSELVLLVDDIYDSGATIDSLLAFELFGVDTIVATLFNNPSATNQSVDFYAREIDRKVDARWVVFPWENC